MVVIVDVDYNEDTRCGHAAGVTADSLLDAQPSGVVTATVGDVGEYIPGQFYRRELKCIDAVLRLLPAEALELIVVDGYADSGTDRKTLGTYVFEEYGVPVIGVAKNRFKTWSVPGAEVLRGGSRKPLYVTCRGMEPARARELVANMFGKYRLPYLIKLADTVARDWSCSPGGQG